MSVRRFLFFLLYLTEFPASLWENSTRFVGIFVTMRKKTRSCTTIPNNKTNKKTTPGLIAHMFARNNAMILSPSLSLHDNKIRNAQPKTGLVPPSIPRTTYIHFPTAPHQLEQFHNGKISIISPLFAFVCVRVLAKFEQLNKSLSNGALYHSMNFK